MHPSIRTAVPTFLSVLTFCASADAAVKTWSAGAAGGDRAWETADNWKPAGAPGVDDDVVFPANSGAIRIEHNGPKVLKSLTMRPSTPNGATRITGVKSTEEPFDGRAFPVSIRAESIVIGDHNSVVGADAASGFAGGEVELTSFMGTIELGAGTVIRGGSGGLEADGSPPGSGGDVVLLAETIKTAPVTGARSSSDHGNGGDWGKTVQTSPGAHISGGNAGAGAVPMPVGEVARGGDVTITGHNNLLLQGSISGGDGRGRGGAVTITADSVLIKTGRLGPYLAVQGGNGGAGTGAPGGEVWIEAKKGDAVVQGVMIRGGIGSPATGAVAAGQGGDVVVDASGPANDILLTQGPVLHGGNAGAGDVAAAQGGSVLLFGNGNIVIGKLYGGNGTGAGAPKGDIIVLGGGIFGLPGWKMLGRNVIIIIEPPAGAAAAPDEAPLIDLSNGSTGALHATDSVFLDAGCAGWINLQGCAPDVITCDGGPGSVEIEAWQAQIETDMPLDQLTEPDALVDEASACTDTCPPDFNGDGIVDAADLMTFITLWDAEASEADLNGDDMVDGLDLAILLAGWGPC